MSDYEHGVDRGVIYYSGLSGEPWVGLTAVTEDPTDADEQSRYVDGVKTRLRRRVGSFAGTIEAYTYPDSFYKNVLLQNGRQNFGLSYRVLNGESYEIHLVYNISISPGGISREQKQTDTFKWGFTTFPVSIPGVRSSSHLVVDASKAYSWTVESLENILYGSDENDARLPLPDEVLNIFDLNSILRVIDNGDGTFTVTGPDSAIQMLDPDTFQIDWPSAVYIDADSYTIHSL